MLKRRVEVRVPATTANLGPGFDCLGMALELFNLVRLETGRSGVIITGEGADTLPAGPENLVYQAVQRAFQRAGHPIPPLALTCRNFIPLARGLGSSSAAIVGGLVAANALMGNPLDIPTLLEMATEIEGHPDNVAPALLGGCQIVVQAEGRLHTAAVPLAPDLRVVVLIPDQPMPTQQARAVLPPQVSRPDAVFNLGRVALLVNALHSRRWDDLALATQDRLHQPARQALFPAMPLIFKAALDAGALGVFLSGAGSSIVALTRGREMTIGYEMLDMAHKAGVSATVQITRPWPQGAEVVGVE
ncbi:MAG: homoserine kinase [Dehalococcoidia bacterium]|nr:homoserine kinase [Dehalococcoidia bacterium]MDW8120010.1 homoserine kinase [Chloroflexota bacterium]